jgi:antitoxin VapB
MLFPGRIAMALTRAFKSGNSQAVRIPADLAYDDIAQDLRITRLGDVITIAPATSSLAKAAAILAELPRLPEIERIERIDLPDRDWD